MCGIAGFNWKDKDKVVSMQSCLLHRGPDSGGFFVDDNFSISHRRLSVIDLSPEANQPMEDDTFVIAYNGEIYNFKELRNELSSQYSFKTKSDTEVILIGYRKWGKGVFSKLNGMFSIAIYDKLGKELICARDRFGIKPLYYFWDNKSFIFASEIKSIFQHNIPRELNLDAFNRYMRILYSPEPETLVKNIFKLPPSTILTFNGANIILEKYGEMVSHASDLTYKEAVVETKEKVMRAVERELVSDVPIGVYLSGGIDSSVVLNSMSKFINQIKTFSVGFELEDAYEEVKFNQDFELAKRTAKYFNTKHFELKISSKEALDNFESMVFHNDDIVSNPTSIPMLLLSRFAKNEVKVVLSGNGGDELFGGYDRYRMALVANYYKKIPKSFRNILKINHKLSKLDYENDIDIYSKFMFEKDFKLRKVISSKAFEDDTNIKKFFKDKYFTKNTNDVVGSIMSADRQSWLVDQALNLGDKMSMGGSIEERVPFLDNDLVNFAENLPTSYKVDLFNTKKILKDAFKEDLPDFLFNQPKRGWFSPGAKWFREKEFRSFAKEVLSRDYYSATSELFDWHEVQKMLDDHLSKKGYNLTILWALMTFQVWAKKYSIYI